MLKSFITLTCFLIVVGAFTTALNGNDSEKHWPQWRGHDGNGVALHSAPPIEWGEEKNILWKLDLPGDSHSTPVIWEDKLFVLTAIKTGEAKVEEKPEEETSGRSGRRRRMRGIKPSHVMEFKILALDRNTGKTIWEKTAEKKFPHEGLHPDSTWASGSPATDGEHVIAYFGSYGIFCYDMDGKLIWKKDLGDMKTRASFGEGASPYLYKDWVIVNWDHEGQSFITVLEKKTGKEVWRKDRNEETSWTTPLVVEHEGWPQVIVNGYQSINSYDIQTGHLIWKCKGKMTQNVVPVPLHGNGMVYLTSGFRGAGFVAINIELAMDVITDESNDITKSDAVVWRYDKNTPYVPSPLLYKDRVYFFQSNYPVLTCLDAKTGEPVFSKQKIEGMRGVYSSPVAANGHIYLTGRRGAVVVIEAGKEYKVKATNWLEDQFSASPVIVGDEIYMRGHENLYCISAKTKESK